MDKLNQIIEARLESHEQRIEELESHGKELQDHVRKLENHALGYIRAYGALYRDVLEIGEALQKQRMTPQQAVEHIHDALVSAEIERQLTTNG
ncbi:MAG: hypothetical protein JO307_14485 [Bryobacterales bacterium]|nr:hypothetical protein [Bryobacterales bacterium]